MLLAIFALNVLALHCGVRTFSTCDEKSASGTPCRCFTKRAKLSRRPKQRLSIVTHPRIEKKLGPVAFHCPERLFCSFEDCKFAKYVRSLMIEIVMWT